MKHLTIRHFGPVGEADIELKRINLIIGPQSSGKSTVLKVACFCDWMEKQIELTQDPEKFCNPAAIATHLIGFHRLEGYMRPDTYIRYENDAVTFDYSAETKMCSFKWKESKRWKYRRSKIAYIPAERNLVAAIPNWFQVSMNKDNILDFMKEWEFARKVFVHEEQLLDMPVWYRYNAGSGEDRIKLDNGNELALTVVSSGLQSLTPMYVLLRYLTSDFYKETHTNVEQDILRNNLLSVMGRECRTLTEEAKRLTAEAMLTVHHTDLYIEEPESHIFPSAQKSFVYSLVEMLNHRRHTCFIATHSPYILTAFNNVILAGEVARMSKEQEKAVAMRMPKKRRVHFDEVGAFEIKDGKILSILDEDCRLISASAIDAASEEIGADFDFLLNI